MYKIISDKTIRLGSNTFIPVDSENRDYQAYLEWLAAGNTPQPADPAPVPDTSKRDALLASINDMLNDNAIPAKIRAFASALKATL
jgi:hypothetical protein